MSPFVMEIVIEVVKVLVAALVSGLTIYLTFYQKKLKDKLEQKAIEIEREALQSEINRLTSYASQVRSFDVMDYDSRVEAVVESVMDYMMRKDLSIHPNEIKMMVEASFMSLRSLENTGLKLYQLKQENKNGKTIKE